MEKERAHTTTPSMPPTVSRLVLIDTWVIWYEEEEGERGRDRERERKREEEEEGKGRERESEGGKTMLFLF